jgi:hypothetical protein
MPRGVLNTTTLTPRRIKTPEQVMEFLTAHDRIARVQELCGGITRQAVVQWKLVPTKHMKAIEKEFGIPREVQRPDLFG